MRELQFYIFFDKCSNEEKICNCIPPKTFRCNKCLEGVYYCSPNESDLKGNARPFKLNSSDEESYRIGFMWRADTKKIRQIEENK